MVCNSLASYGRHISPFWDADVSGLKRWLIYRWRRWWFYIPLIWPQAACLSPCKSPQYMLHRYYSMSRASLLSNVALWVERHFGILFTLKYESASQNIDYFYSRRYHRYRYMQDDMRLHLRMSSRRSICTTTIQKCRTYHFSTHTTKYRNETDHMPELVFDLFDISSISIQICLPSPRAFR